MLWSSCDIKHCWSFNNWHVWHYAVTVQLGEHERALRLLVHKLRDFPAAENYCLINTSESDVAERARLFHMLLSVYLDPNNELVISVLFFWISDGILLYKCYLAWWWHDVFGVYLQSQWSKQTASFLHSSVYSVFFYTSSLLGGLESVVSFPSMVRDRAVASYDFAAFWMHTKSLVCACLLPI